MTTDDDDDDDDDDVVGLRTADTSSGSLASLVMLMTLKGLLS